MSGDCGPALRFGGGDLMGTETEIKVKLGSAEDFRRRLSLMKPRLLHDRHFEDNHLLDFEDGRLKSGGCLIRVRRAGESSCLTFKGPPRPESVFKIREELETRLEDGSVALRVLERLGLRVWFRYQKYRQEFEIDGVVVAVDETPVGDYAEFEGPEERIRALTRKMGIEPSQFINSSYYSLYLEHCRERGAAPGHMVF